MSRHIWNSLQLYVIMFVSGRLVISITDKTDVHDISEIFLEVVLYTQNGRDRMVVGFPATCAISAYDH